MSIGRRRKRDRKTGEVREIWFAEVRWLKPDGTVERIRRDSDVQTERGALAFERGLIADMARGEIREKKEAPRERIPTFAEFSEEFIRDYVEVNNKYSEQRGKKANFRNHLVPYFGKMRLDQIRSRMVEQYKARKLAEGHAAKTVNNQLVVLGKTLRQAVEWEIITHAPRIKMLKVPEAEFDFLEFDELDRLLAVEESEWATMILFAARTGVRLGEMLAVRWEDVDLVKAVLVVRKNAVYRRIGTPKSGRNRQIPLCGSLVEALKAHRHLRGELIFSDVRGGLLETRATYHHLHRICRRAGLRKIGWHVLRHTFASHLAMRGVPMRGIQELLGHATIMMTTRYAHLSPDTRRDYVNLLDEKGNRRATEMPSSLNA